MWWKGLLRSRRRRGSSKRSGCWHAVAAERQEVGVAREVTGRRHGATLHANAERSEEWSRRRNGKGGRSEAEDRSRAKRGSERSEPRRPKADEDWRQIDEVGLAIGEDARSADDQRGRLV